MRWSLFSLVALLAVLIADVTALPTPQEGSTDLVLERRAATRPKVAKGKTTRPAASKKVSGKMTAGSFKKGSKTYRNAALQGKNPMFTVKSGRISKGAPPKKMPKTGKVDADHIFEAQTMKHAAQKAGHSLTTLAPALKLIKDRINHPKNMAFLDPATNRAKGKMHTDVQAGRNPTPNKNVASYLQSTAAAGRATAQDVNKILKNNGIKGVDVVKAHNDVLKKGGVKKREYSDVDLD